MCHLLSPLGKKVDVNVHNTLYSADVVWCLLACKECFEEMVISAYRGSVHAVADFLRQLTQLTSLSIVQLPHMECSTKRSESICSEGT